MRMAWADNHNEKGSPRENSWTMGVHLYDFWYNNPKGYNIGATATPKDQQLGQIGGLGGTFYKDQWYCIEMEVDLNTVRGAAAEANAGNTSGAGGWLPDGSIRVWVDG